MNEIENVKKEVLLRELKKHAERKVMLELQIALQRELDPEEMSARKPLRFGSNGQPISYQEIKRKEHIVILESELEDVNLILKVVESLML